MSRGRRLSAAGVRLVLLNKPFRVLTRFRRGDARATLADFIGEPGLYPAGRLDYDSEGLLLLTDDGLLQSLITDPRHTLEKVYLAQVEGVPDAAALARLRAGVELPDGRARPAGARLVAEPAWLWPRDPPIRARAAIPVAWLELTLREGRNRQVRRMTAAVGHPTLRLVRVAIGPWQLAGLAPGSWREAPRSALAAWRAQLAPLKFGARAGRFASRPRAPARSSAAGRPSSGRRARGRCR